MAKHAGEKRLRRKDLKLPDEFETLVGQSTHWAQLHRPIVLGAVAVAVGVGLVAVIVSRYQGSQAEVAASAFRTAHDDFSAQKFHEAAEAFAAVSRDYPRTPSGRLSGLYRGHALVRQGDPTAAVTAYTEYLAGTSQPAYLRQEALAGLARAREATGDAPGALEAYDEASALEGPFTVDVKLGAARLSEASGQPDRAREIYSGLLKGAADPELKAFLVAKLPPGTDTTPDAAKAP